MGGALMGVVLRFISYFKMASEDSRDFEPYPALVTWLEKCLVLSGAGEGYSMNINDISDGTAIAASLMHVDPHYFTKQWGTKIIPEASASWRLKMSNLKKILKSMQEYYAETLHVNLGKFTIPDVSKIAEHNDEGEMVRLLQLLLGIAVQCEDKEKYIQGIMSMEERVQHTVMQLIQELMSIGSPSMIQIDVYKELEEQYQRTAEDLKNQQAENDKLQQKIFEIQKNLTAIEGELEETRTEVKDLRDKVPPDDFGTPGGVKLQRVNRKLEDIRKEKLRAEYERDEFMSQIEELERKVTELEQKNSELAATNEEIPLLRDSLEESKYLEAKVKSYESVISQYKKKLELLQEVKREKKSLEDKNMMYVQQIMDLEEELRMVSSSKEQFESLRKKISGLEHDLAQENLKVLEALQDCEEKSTLLESMTADNRELRKQLEHHQSATPTTTVPPLTAEFHIMSSEEEIDSSESLMEAFTPELKEKMFKLEKENEILRRRVANSETSVAAGNDTQEIEGLRLELVDKSMEIDRLKQGIAKKGKELEGLAHFRDNYDQIKSQMKAKDIEIEKLKKFLNKAKKIIESFGDKKSDVAADSAEVQQLKGFLQERDREIERMERTFEQERQTREKEERLILSAWYNLGVKFHQLQSKERLVTQGSFLTQQRQAALKRHAPSSGVTPTTSSTFSLN